MHGLQPVQYVIGVGDLVAARIGERGQQAGVAVLIICIAPRIAIGTGNGCHPSRRVTGIGSRAQAIHHGVEPVVLVIGEMNRGAVLVTHRVHLAGGGVGIGCGVPVAVGAAVDGAVVIVAVTGDPAKGIGLLGDQAPVFSL